MFAFRSRPSSFRLPGQRRQPFARHVEEPLAPYGLFRVGVALSNQFQRRGACQLPAKFIARAEGRELLASDHVDLKMPTVEAESLRQADGLGEIAASALVESSPRSSVRDLHNVNETTDDISRPIVSS
jgi:hypothetical protein